MESPGSTAHCPVRQQRARWERKRVCTARELLETERRYQEQLGLVATYFLGILKAKGTLRPPERQALFGNWERIYAASLELLPYLEEGHWGPGLEGFCSHLDLYTQFAANAESSQAILQAQLKKNKRFRRFVRLQEGRPEFSGLQLQDLLPLPLQRLQHSVGNEVDGVVPGAARLVSATAQRVHAIGQSQKNDQHLLRVQALLSGRKAKGLTSGRWFLRQGWLLVVPPTGEPRPRMFFLFSDVLLMVKPRPPLHLLKSGTFVCRALYPMSQCQLSRVFGHSGGTCGGLLSVSYRWEIQASDVLQAYTDTHVTWPGPFP
ncbi:Rho guanine nucleotide exchange factor 39 [Lemmus lemmus]